MIPRWMAVIMANNPGVFVSEDWFLLEALDARGGMDAVKTVFATADQARSRGFEKWGMNACFEVCRWETAANMRGQFKMDDRLHPILARLYNLSKPERRGFFRTKTTHIREKIDES